MTDALSMINKRGKRSILIVSNRTQEVFFIVMLLQRFEYEVQTAHTVAHALDQVAFKTPDLVISDLTLPGLSGLDLLYMLRLDNRAAALPVVFLIPVNEAFKEIQCIDKGASAVVSTPIHAEDLYRTVQTIIEPVPRANIRIETHLAVSINNVPLPDPDNAGTIELSEQGMFVPMQKPFARGERVRVQLRINNRMVEAECTVLYAHTVAGPHHAPGMGLKFLHISAEDQDRIREFIRDHITQGMDAA